MYSNKIFGQPEGFQSILKSLVMLCVKFVAILFTVNLLANVVVIVQLLQLSDPLLSSIFKYLFTKILIFVIWMIVFHNREFSMYMTGIFILFYLIPIFVVNFLKDSETTYMKQFNEQIVQSNMNRTAWKILYLTDIFIVFFVFFAFLIFGGLLGAL